MSSTSTDFEVTPMMETTLVFQYTNSTFMKNNSTTVVDSLQYTDDSSPNYTSTYDDIVSTYSPTTAPEVTSWFSRWQYLFLTLIPLLSIIFNSLLLACVKRHPPLHKTIYWILASLAFKDLLSSGLVMPFTIVRTITERFPFPEMWCQAWQGLDAIFTASGFIHLALGICDCHITLLNPVKYQIRKVYHYTALNLILCWGIGFVLAMPYIVLMIYGNSLFSPSGIILGMYRGCTAQDLSQVLSRTIGTCLFPVCLIVMVSVWTLNDIHRQNQVAERLQSDGCSLATSNGDVTGYDFLECAVPQTPDKNTQQITLENITISNGDPNGDMISVGITNGGKSMKKNPNMQDIHTNSVEFHETFDQFILVGNHMTPYSDSMKTNIGDLAYMDHTGEDFPNDSPDGTSELNGDIENRSFPNSQVASTCSSNGSGSNQDSSITETDSLSQKSSSDITVIEVNACIHQQESNHEESENNTNGDDHGHTGEQSPPLYQDECTSYTEGDIHDNPNEMFMYENETAESDASRSKLMVTADVHNTDPTAPEMNSGECVPLNSYCSENSLGSSSDSTKEIYDMPDTRSVKTPKVTKEILNGPIDEQITEVITEPEQNEISSENAFDNLSYDDNETPLSDAIKVSHECKIKRGMNKSLSVEGSDSQSKSYPPTRSSTEHKPIRRTSSCGDSKYARRSILRREPQRRSTVRKNVKFASNVSSPSQSRGNSVKNRSSKGLKRRKSPHPRKLARLSNITSTVATDLSNNKPRRTSSTKIPPGPPLERCNSIQSVTSTDLGEPLYSNGNVSKPLSDYLAQVHKLQSKRMSERIKQQEGIFHMLLLLAIIYSVLYIPQSVVYITARLCSGCMHAVPSYVAFLLDWIPLSTSIITPCVYFIWKPEIRQGLKKLCKCRE